ncbi:MAG: hypothetical protein ACRCX2_19885 [Paraclostridium sp.]
MNKKYFNAKYTEAFSVINDISKLKNEIDVLKNEVSSKKEVLNSSYQNKMSLSNQKEKKIKSLMDNRHFRYMKMIDFLSNTDIEEMQGFSINEDSGFIMSEITKKPEVNLFSKSINPSNNKEIIFEFDNSVYSNLLSFTFKDKSGLPIAPKKIRIEYNGIIEDFFEPNFRYYNRNASNVYVNNFFFYPKKILRIYATFSGDYDFNNSKCSLYACSFNTDANSYIDIPVSNNSNISSFNIFKSTDETNVPLVFEYTEDNSTYKEIKFDKQEAVILLEKFSDFKIKVKKNYENVKQKEFTENVKININVNDMDVVNNVRTFNMNGKIIDFDIIFTQSSYKRLREDVKNAFNGTDTISEFILNDNGVYKVRKEFVSLINEPSDSINNLIFNDDINSLKDDKSLFNFYVDEQDKVIHFSSFMENYSFFLKLENEIVVDSVPSDMLTPYLFDLQIKG